MTALAFYVPGKPQTAGSKQAYVIPTKDGGHRAVVSESGSKEVKQRKRDWRADLRAAAERAALDVPTAELRPVWNEEALSVMFVEVRKRPSTHLTTGRAAGLVKDWAKPLRPTTRPDALKIARAAEDALTRVVWADDAQIVHEVLEKVYGDQAGLTPSAEGLIVVVRAAGEYAGPTLEASRGAGLNPQPPKR